MADEKHADEEWAALACVPNHEISRGGQVRTVLKKVVRDPVMRSTVCGPKMWRTAWDPEPSPPEWRLALNIPNNNRIEDLAPAYLTAITFLGPHPEGHCIERADGGSSCSAEQLRWVLHPEPCPAKCPGRGFWASQERLTCRALDRFNRALMRQTEARSRRRAQKALNLKPGPAQP